MPPVNDYPSRKEWENACWRKILGSEDLLQMLVTPHERHNLVARAAAMDELISGKRYRQIAEELWLSPQTISSVKRAIKEDSYRSYRERGKKERKKRQYSGNLLPAKPRRRGRPLRTKYGTIYLPR